MTDDRRRVAALAGFGLVCLLTAVTPLLASGITRHPDLARGELGYDVGFAFTGTALAITALVLCWLRPRNAVGWLLGLGALLGAVCSFGQVYGARALVLPDSPLPAGALVLSWTAPLWIPTLLVPATLVLARYPSGRTSGRWGRRVERATVVFLVVVWVGYAGSAFSVTDEVPTARPPVLLPDLVAGALLAVGGIGSLSCVVLTVVLTIRRLLRADWPERPQLALLLVTAPLAVAVVMLVDARWVGSVAFSTLPLAIAVGVLRYRLLGIEVVVRRTLLYGALTGAVLLLFVAVTTALASVIPAGPAPQVVAAGVVAVALSPLRERLQRAVDRLLYGDRSDPWSALGRLGREAAGPEGLSEVVAAIGEALRLPGVEVRGVDGTSATYGGLGADAHVVPLRVAGADVGELQVAPRRGERVLAASDLRLLSALAPVLALLLRSAALASALQVEQDRAASATRSERARLRRDLHDGLGPSLTGIGLGLEAVDDGALPDRSRAILARVRAEVGTSLEEVRRIIDDLRPGALEATDLLAVVRQRAFDVSATTSVQVRVVAPDALPPLPSQVEVAALRIVDEALNNVLRHAGATECTIELGVDDALRLSIRDDGAGFTAPRPGGVGLTSMRSRAAALGGRLELTSSALGTHVEAELPVAVPA